MPAFIHVLCYSLRTKLCGIHGVIEVDVFSQAEDIEVEVGL